MPSEVFDQFMVHMSRCAMAFRAATEREERRVVITQLFISCDATGVSGPFSSTVCFVLLYHSTMINILNKVYKITFVVVLQRHDTQGLLYEVYKIRFVVLQEHDAHILLFEISMNRFVVLQQHDAHILLFEISMNRFVVLQQHDTHILLFEIYMNRFVVLQQHDTHILLCEVYIARFVVLQLTAL